MRCLLLCVYLCVIGSDGTSTSEYEAKGGTFPYMAVVYYIDDTIVEDGKRFVRNAILIRPDWLVSAAIEVQGNTTFPRKTLVARAGADSINANYTIYEEDMEQDREIIQVVQPSKDKMEAWGYDSHLSLLKTIVPFNITSAVAPTALAEEIQDYAGKKCFVVVFGHPNNSEDQILMKSPVEILPQDSCKSKEDIICSVHNSSASDDFGLCPRNRGGPLVCEEEVVGAQSYLSGCQQPHLHIALAAWREFIACGVQEQCGNATCSCSAHDKDPPVTIGALRTSAMTTTTTTDLSDGRRNIDTVAVNESNIPYLKEEIKRTSDIAANLDYNATDAYDHQTDVFSINVTTSPATSPEGTIFILVESPTRTADLKTRNNSTRVVPNRPIARTRSQAANHVINDLVSLLSILSVFV